MIKMMLCIPIKEKELFNISQSENHKNNYIYEPKKDGLRAWLVYSKKNGIKIWNRDRKNITNLFPEFKNLKFDNDVIFDGELCEKNFATLMSRIHLKDNFKINLLSRKSNIVFYAFDILFVDDKQISDLMLMNRKRILDTFAEYQNKNFVLMPFYLDLDIALNEFKNEEGIILKDKMSKYEFNVRSDKWLKYKKRVEKLIRFCKYEVNKDRSITLTDDFNRVKCNDLIAKVKIDTYGYVDVEVEGLEFTEQNHIRFPQIKRLI